MSKEFESLCLTSQVQDCPLPKREPGKGRFSTVVPHLAELWAVQLGASWWGATANQGLLFSSTLLCWVGISLSWAFTQHLPKGRVSLCRELEQHGVATGEVKLQLCWSQREISQSYSRLERQQKDHTRPRVRRWNYYSPMRDFVVVVVKRLRCFLSFAPTASWLCFYPCSCFMCWSRGISVSEDLREALRSFMEAVQW